ncbi:MAG TPA: peptidoglycan editing factor PgeF [Pseudobacteroides sp.]|uniref:peptidoglycan editing factor PgeF n=1 Tax=Pseudobacteroides sp. TaxID=1968840 RepID=UPI002F921921
MKEIFINNNNITYNSINGVEFIQFSNLKKYQSTISHGFTTRIGGVSTGECSSLNMGFNRKDTRENVLENYRRVAEVLNIDSRDMVLSKQVHDSKIKAVGEQDRGKGIFKESDIQGYDGLMTNERSVALVTFYADCVPLLFFDPQKKVIAESHSGWRGTLKEIAKETLISMNKEYGCLAQDIVAAVGPSIGKCCFEVGKEVYEEFKAKHNDIDIFCEWLNDEKLKIDLQGIIKRTMVGQGVREENICMSEICTKCNNDIFFSHRGDSGRTGSLTAIMQIL